MSKIGPRSEKLLDLSLAPLSPKTAKSKPNDKTTMDAHCAGFRAVLRINTDINATKIILVVLQTTKIDVGVRVRPKFASETLATFKRVGITRKNHGATKANQDFLASESASPLFSSCLCLCCFFLWKKLCAGAKHNFMIKTPNVTNMEYLNW